MEIDTKKMSELIRQEMADQRLQGFTDSSFLAMESGNTQVHVRVVTDEYEFINNTGDTVCIEP